MYYDRGAVRRGTRLGAEAAAHAEFGDRHGNRPGRGGGTLFVFGGLFAFIGVLLVSGILFGVFRLVPNFGSLHADLFGDAGHRDRGSIRQRTEEIILNELVYA